MKTLTYPGPLARFPGQIAIPLRRRTLSYLADLQKTYGDVVAFRIGRTGYFLLSGPDAIRDVLVTHEDAFIKGPALQRARSALGDGLLTSEGDFHRRQRQLSQPAFHPQRVGGYAAAMADFARQTSESWRDGQAIDLHREMMRLTLRIVAKTLFDAEVESDVDELGQAMDIIVGMFTRAMSPWGPLLNMLPLPSNFRFKLAHQRLQATIDRMIADRRAGGTERNDLLSMLLRAREGDGDAARSSTTLNRGDGMSDRQLRDESFTIFTAGHETTANALTFSLYLLSQHPESHLKLRDELSGVLSGRMPGLPDVENLPFTRAVLAESMRLFPPAWALGRQARRDVEVAAVRIPKDSVVLMSQWVVHHDPRWWHESDRFRPERWLNPGAIAARPRWSYFPFGGGPRQCIGESFAWMEAMIVLAVLARDWRVELIDDRPLKLMPTITLRPADGVKARVWRWA